MRVVYDPVKLATLRAFGHVLGYPEGIGSRFGEVYGAESEVDAGCVCGSGAFGNLHNTVSNGARRGVRRLGREGEGILFRPIAASQHLGAA